MDNSITNEMELALALDVVKEDFTKWLKSLKEKRKRTFSYSEHRAMWQGVQRRMEGDFKYSREAEKMFHKFFDWCDKTSKKMQMRCVTTR